MAMFKILSFAVLLSRVFALPMTSQPTGNYPLAQQILEFSSNTTNPNGIGNIVVFGDSLSDNGNGTYKLLGGQYPFVNGHWDGRFTDGLMWVEYLSKAWNAALVDMAYGGSTSDNDFINGVLQVSNGTKFSVPGLAQQVDQYIGAANTTIGANETVHMVWSGHNDFYALIDAETAFTNPEIFDGSFLDRIVGNIASSVQKLIDNGAQKIVVLKLAPLDETPVALEYPTFLRLLLKMIVSETNERLVDKLAGIPQVQIFDTIGAFSSVIDAPSMYNMTDISNACLINYEDYNDYPYNENAKANICQSPTETLFWDDVHPTTKGHSLLATKIINWIDGLRL